MPCWFVRDELRNGNLVKALPGWAAPELQINVAYAQAVYRSRRLQAFIERLSSSLPGLLAG